MPMSVADFRARLREEMTQVAEGVGWNLGSNIERGHAFQLWLARLICESEGLDANPEETLLFARDLKADVVIEDEENQRLIICQAKYVAMSSPVDESEVTDFFDRHEHFLNSDWVREHGSEQAVIALGGYAERIENNWLMDFRFCTTGRASTRVSQAVATKRQYYEVSEIAVSCELLDFDGLKDYYVRSSTLAQDIPDAVQLTLPYDRWILKEEPHRSLIAVLKGNALRDLKRRHKESLYAWNIRGFLGGQGINKAISETIRNDPSDFYYFNNGVSAICTDFEIDGNLLTARNFQIINGAQTVSSLAAQDAEPSIEVLFRLTKTNDVSTDSGFNHDLIRFNNSQNPIKLSDFRSNDQIQLFLERSFNDRRATPAMPKVRYQRKRTVAGRRGVGQSIKLEELAKVRYSFFYEPTLVHASPRALWASDGQDAAYAKAFGIDGELKDSWTSVEFNETCLAVALYGKISTDARDRRESLPALFRLRFHLLALAGLYWSDYWSEGDAAAVLASTALYDTLWDGFALEARRAVTTEWTRAEDDSTLFAFVRSNQAWETIKRTFEADLRVR